MKKRFLFFAYNKVIKTMQLGSPEIKYLRYNHLSDNAFFVKIDRRNHEPNWETLIIFVSVSNFHGK